MLLLSKHGVFDSVLPEWAAAAPPVPLRLARAVEATDPESPAAPAVAREALDALEQALWWPLRPPVATLMTKRGLTCPSWLTELVEWNVYTRVLEAILHIDVLMVLAPPARPAFAATVPPDESAAHAIRRLKAELHQHRGARRPGDRPLPAKGGKTLHRHVEWFFAYYILGHSLHQIAVGYRSPKDAPTIKAGIAAAARHLPGLHPLRSPAP